MAESNEEREHIDSPDCWCHLDLILKGVDGKFGSVLVHKAPGEELAPAWVIASAVASAFSGRDEP